MKVLLLCYRGSPYCGGQGIYIYYLSRELAKKGIEVDVAVGPPYPDPLDEWATVHYIENLNIWSVKTADFSRYQFDRVLSPWNYIDYLLTRFHIFSEMETFSGRVFIQLRKLLKMKRYDIIHDVNTLGWGLIPAKGFGIPIVSTIHHPLTQDRNADLTTNRTFWDKMTTLLFYPIRMQKCVINSIDRVITSSYECTEELNRAFKLDKDKISVVYNGMDTECFKNTGEPRKENAILFVGNTEDQKKGFRFCLEALSMLPEEVHLTVVDDGPPAKVDAWKHVTRYHLEHRVTFTGKLDLIALVRHYCTQSILVMSSLYEGFGLPAAEAMACNTPVVATRAGALKEVVDESCGILVEPGNAIELARAIRELLSDRKRRESMGSYGRNRAEALFAWPIAAENTIRVYEDVIHSFGR